MNFLEKKIYGLVKSRPWIKEFLKYLYQSLFSLISSKGVDSINPISTREKAYFGFHDKSPWSVSDKYLAANSFEGIGNESIENSGEQDIVVYKGENWLEKIKISKTSAWNWQQGSQLQWVGESSSLIFNTFHEGDCKAKIVDVETSDFNYKEYPIAALSSDGKLFASICFETFGKVMPGYGYNFKKYGSNYNAFPNKLVVGELNGDSTIFHEIDCTNLEDSSIPDEKNEGKICISHCQFSPDHEFLTFMKRLSIPGKRLHSELYCLSLKNGKIKKMPFYNMVSHYCFFDEKSILVFANDVNQNDGFYQVDVTTYKIKNVTEIFNSVDGHPHSSIKSDKIIFDTYPDRSRHQNLYLYQKSEKKSLRVARLYAPLKFKGSGRVDLHPRIRKDGKFVCFDSSFTGKRSLSTMPL